MIKDVVVHIRTGRQEDFAGDYAIFMADTLRAHLTAIAFAYEPIDLVSHLGYIAKEVMSEQWRDFKNEAKQALDRLGKMAATGEVLFEPVTVSASFAGASDQFGRIARRFDLTVVDQAESGRSGIGGTIIESALFDSGRPVIIVPPIQRSALKLNRVMICWDGSRAAVRAIADAMPLLELAGHTELVIVANERGKQREIEGVHMGQHLARHEIDVEIKCIAHGTIDVADALLSHAADSCADFIVMGGYGHSRLREFVLGGVTQSMLRSMTVPVLMSH